MEKKRISVWALLVISATVLIFTNAVTYLLLMSKNEEWKSVITEKENNTYELTAALSEYVYYDGDSIQCNQTVGHYSRSGKLVESKNLCEVLQGEKVVMLFSPNCCSACAKSEIEKMQELTKKIGRKRIVVIADFPMHMQSAWTLLFDKEGYYETDVEHLGLEGSPTKGTPLLLLTQNGRIKTSFVVGSQTSKYTEVFHEYLVEYFKGKK